MPPSPSGWCCSCRTSSSRSPSGNTTRAGRHHRRSRAAHADAEQVHRADAGRDAGHRLARGHGEIGDFFADDRRGDDLRGTPISPIRRRLRLTTAAMSSNSATATSSTCRRTSGIRKSPSPATTLPSTGVARGERAGGDRRDRPPSCSRHARRRDAPRRLAGRGARLGEGLKTLAMCLMVAVLAAFPRGERRGAGCRSRSWSSSSPSSSAGSAAIRRFRRRSCRTWAILVIAVSAAASPGGCVRAAVFPRRPRHDPHRLPRPRAAGQPDRGHVVIVFGIIFLVESLNNWRFEHLARTGGPMLGIVGNLLYAAFWSLNVLPITLLIGRSSGCSTCARPSWS